MAPMDEPVTTTVTGGESPPSDNDASGERPVRKQLKETSIDSTHTAVNENSSTRKRSFEESRDHHDGPCENGESRRKRSREGTPESTDTKKEGLTMGICAGPGAQSPNIKTTSATMDDESARSLTKKRSREQLDDSSKKMEATSDSAACTARSVDAKFTMDGEPEKKRHRDGSQELEVKPDNKFAASAFGKAVASPFASLSKIQDSTKDNKTPASTSAFASSSLAAFAGSESSPFGALGGSNTSVFNPGASGTSSFSTPSVFRSASGTNSFAAPSETSAFRALGSGFTGVGGGFGTAAKAGGLTSFASASAPVPLGESKAKPLGAEDSDADEADTNEDDNTNTFEASKTDERFYVQTVETGEEEEETAFSCKAKLFHFSNKEWKERGIGTFKINVRRNSNGMRAGRMIMRADGAMRVMLNSPIFKGMNYGDASNEAPINKQILLASLEEGRTVPLLLRVNSHFLIVPSWI
ncbi:hypothetical protein N7466_001656 [Penicillium verhagenii]|uniref:uncharacterized protein n=1 Tax=Penicillium verhagenii TaxID=1562060 RepID=UPI002545936F|nr:uncharacterized protein N7466_001656 [Penicillium verhagenii]KAJ5938522.1 hypothetical protein N7466_001656 [Penicillium verhagenii]